jgi:SP family sugar:H+ symporter-like MFS transporter
MSQATTPEQGSTPFIIFISVIATIGGFLFGYDSGVINGTVKGLQLAFNSESAGTGFSVSSMLLGCAAGALFAGRLADRYGRKALLISASVLFIVSAWGSGMAGSTAEFVLYRILGGLAVGAASVMAPAYISEVAHARYRGMLISVQQMAIIVGLTASFFSNYFLADSAGGSTAEFWLGYETWRWMFWVELIPACLFFVALLAIPESPRYLVVAGHTDTARKVLTRLYGTIDGAAKLTEISDSVATDNHRPRFADLLDKTSGGVRPVVWVGLGLAILQQFVGINVVFYYGAVLWEAAGFTESQALLVNVLSGSISIAACLITFFVVDKIGRKPLLWFGSAGMALSLALVAYAFAGAPLDGTGHLQLTDDAGLLALASANLYVFLFNMSWGPVVWIMLGEMFPNQIRGSGLAVAGLAQWLANFIITWSFPIMLAGIGLSAAYSIYALFAALSVFFVIFMVRETKGKELEEMQ